jgi:predicted Zn-dependent protease
MRRLLACLVVLLAGCAQSGGIKTVWHPQDQGYWRQHTTNGLRLMGNDGSVKAHISPYILKNLLTAKDRVEAASGIKSELALVETESPNAFAVNHEGRNIVAFSTSFLDYLGTDVDALAVTMGHELAHLQLGHIEKSKGRNEARQVVGFVAGFFLGPLAEIGTHAAFNSFSRDQEREADNLGMEWAQKAGFDVCGQARLAMMFKRVGTTQVPFLSTHPGIEERQSEANERSVKAKGKPCS